MIDLIFYHGTEIIFVRVNRNDIKFANSQNSNSWSSIEGLKLSYEGSIKEHPDLKGNDLWREEVIKRFKEKIKSFETEDEKADYIISDLKKYGFIPKFKQKQGFRKEAIK